MIRKQPWFERQFPTSLPAALFPVIVERLRGTPARLEDRLHPVPASILTRRSGTTWSAQENAGHLLDLEPLWFGRVEDLLTRRPEMTPADLTNRRTHEANHNAALLGTILSGFRQARAALVGRLERVDESALAYTAPHPRLRVPMNLVDHVYFVAEHDDYHLARITELLVAFRML
jgi:uncharacterized damage-inducible protein DinB